MLIENKKRFVNENGTVKNFLITIGTTFVIIFCHNRNKIRKSYNNNSTFKTLAKKFDLKQIKSQLNFSVDNDRNTLYLKNRPVDFGLYTLKEESLQKAQEIHDIEQSLQNSSVELEKWYNSFQHANQRTCDFALKALFEECRIDSRINNIHKQINNLILKYFKYPTAEKIEPLFIKHFFYNYKKFCEQNFINERNNSDFCLSFIENFTKLIECIRLVSINICCLQKMDFEDKEIIKKICPGENLKFVHKYIFFKHFSSAVHIDYVNLLIIRLKIFAQLLNTPLIRMFASQAIRILSEAEMTIIEKCKKEKEKYLFDQEICDFNLFIGNLPANFFSKG